MTCKRHKIYWSWQALRQLWAQIITYECAVVQVQASTTWTRFLSVLLFRQIRQNKMKWLTKFMWMISHWIWWRYIMTTLSRVGYLKLRSRRTSYSFKFRYGKFNWIFIRYRRHCIAVLFLLNSSKVSDPFWCDCSTGQVINSPNG